MTTITRQAPSTVEQQRLIGEVETTSYIAHLSQSELTAWIADNTICFAYDEAGCVGFVAWQIISKHWVELGPLFVSPSTQGKGYGRALIQASIAHTAAYHRYAVSKNPAIHYLLTQADFETTSFQQLPRVIHWHLLKRVLSPRLVRYLRQTSNISNEPMRHYIQFTNQR